MTVHLPSGARPRSFFLLLPIPEKKRKKEREGEVGGRMPISHDVNTWVERPKLVELLRKQVAVLIVVQQQQQQTGYDNMKLSPPSRALFFLSDSLWKRRRRRPSSTQYSAGLVVHVIMATHRKTETDVIKWTELGKGTTDDVAGTLRSFRGAPFVLARALLFRLLFTR